LFSLPVKNRDEAYTIQPGKIIALGKNYLEHIKEFAHLDVQGFDDKKPEEPILFPKTINTLIPPGANIILPALLKEYNFEDCRTDYEAELALIIGTECKHVKKEDAYDVIFGFTCMNDVSQRNIQRSDKSGWFRGKSFDTFGPIGPVIVRTQDIGNPMKLDIQCRLNGKTVQKGNTSQMIFSIPEIIEFVSRNFTLNAGDIITTGTPSGVGPLKEGDIVEIEIEHIGILENQVIEEVLK